MNKEQLTPFKPDVPGQWPADKPDKAGREIYASDREEEGGREKARAKLLELLKEKGIFEQINGYTVVDIDKFKKTGLPPTIHLGRIGNKKRIDASRLDIFDLLSDLKVVSRSEYEIAQQNHETPGTKPLFNRPASIDEAFDMEKIKTDDYYLNAWEFNENSPVYWNKDLELANGEKVKLSELYLATKIFRDYSGERIQPEDQATDELRVYYHDENAKRRITYDWLTQELHFNAMNSKRGKKRGVHYFLNTQCPHLLEKGLVKLEDFRTRDTGTEGGLNRGEWYPPPGKGKMEIMANSIKYYIGRGEKFRFKDETIPRKNLKVALLDNNTAGIIETYEGREILKYTFDLLNEEEKAARRKEIVADKGPLSEDKISALTYVKKRELDRRLDNFSLSSVFTKKSGSYSEEQIEKLGDVTNDYSYIKKVTEKFKKDGNIGIHNLTWREQMWLAAAVHNIGVQDKYDDLVKTVREHGLSGLKAFLSCEIDMSNGFKIIDMDKKLAPEASDRIFAKIAGLTDRVEDDLRDLLAENVNVDREEIRFELLKRAHRIIQDFSGEEKDVEILLKDLENSKIEITLLSSLLKVARESGIKLTPENIRDMKMETFAIGELTGDKKEEFMKKYGDDISRMIKTNYEENIFRNNPAAAGKVRGDITRRLEHIENYRVRMLTFRDELVAFMTIRPDEKEKGAVWAESFMVETDAQKYSLGSAFARGVMAEEAREHTVLGKVRADNEAIIESHEKIGFTFGDPFTEEGVEYLKMRKEKGKS